MPEPGYPRYEDILDWQDRAPAPTAERSVDELWRAVKNGIPSGRFAGLESAFGFRQHLASAASSLTEGGGRVRYLEVGVRRGHSLALVALASGDQLERAVGVDLWIPDYGGEPQTGPCGVLASLRQLGVDTGRVELFTGDSHQVLPILAATGATFNLILVDGDHTAAGASRDLFHCWPMVEPGGVLVFDDLLPAAAGGDDLEQVWIDFVDGASGIEEWQADVRSTPRFAWARRFA